MISMMHVHELELDDMCEVVSEWRDLEHMITQLIYNET
jgi:hypothetical protein